MATTDPGIPDRRAALVLAARHLVAEAGPDGGALVDPDLARAVAGELARDVAVAIRRRTADAGTLDELVAAFVGAVAEASEPWRDSLGLATMALERTHDFERWAMIVRPWLDAVEDALVEARRRGIVRADVDPATTALVVRDALDRSVRLSARFEREDYRTSAAALVRAALRA
jgi:hypothetical protein